MVPQLTDLREEILREFHCSRFAVHLGGTKMFQDLLVSNSALGLLYGHGIFTIYENLL